MTSVTDNPPTGHIELQIGGMTCASCAARIEKKLNKIDGVTASVNFATEKARVDYVGEVSPEELVAAVEEAGYKAELPQPSTPDAGSEATAAEGTDPTASLRQRLLVSLVLTVPVIAMAMVPALQFTNWQWLSLTLAAPVVVWGAWPFHTGGVGQPAARQRHDGHADLHGHARRFGLVHLRAVLGHCRDGGHDASVRADHRPYRRHRQHLSGSRCRRDDVHPGRPVL